MELVNRLGHRKSEAVPKRYAKGDYESLVALNKALKG